MHFLLGVYSSSPWISIYFRLCIVLKYQIVLIYLAILLIVGCFVGVLGCVQLIVVMLDGRCIGTLFYRNDKNEISPIPTPPLIFFLALQPISFSRVQVLDNETHWSDLFVFAIMLFWVVFYSPQLLLYCLGLWRSVPDIVFLLSFFSVKIVFSPIAFRFLYPLSYPVGFLRKTD